MCLLLVLLKDDRLSNSLNSLECCCQSETPEVEAQKSNPFFSTKKNKFHLLALSFLCKSSEWYPSPPRGKALQKPDVRSTALTWFNHWIQIWKAKVKPCSQEHPAFTLLAGFYQCCKCSQPYRQPLIWEYLWKQRASSTLWADENNLRCCLPFSTA